jgi:hypothetical protein
MGTGDWLRGQTEHCLMAVRGRPTVTLEPNHAAARADARAQPQADEFYALVESLCPARSTVGSSCSPAKRGPAGSPPAPRSAVREGCLMQTFAQRLQFGRSAEERVARVLQHRYGCHVVPATTHAAQAPSG